MQSVQSAFSRKFLGFRAACQLVGETFRAPLSLYLLPPRFNFLESFISMKFQNTFHPYRSGLTEWQVDREQNYVCSIPRADWWKSWKWYQSNFLSPSLSVPSNWRDFSPPSPSQTDLRSSQGDEKVMESTNIHLSVRNIYSQLHTYCSDKTGNLSFCEVPTCAVSWTTNRCRFEAEDTCEQHGWTWLDARQNIETTLNIVWKGLYL